MWTRVLIRRICTLLVTALLGGILGATLVRFAPGFGVEERELDTRLREDSVQALRRSHSNERNLLKFYGAYLGGVLHGDLGVSHSFARPIAGLFAERLPVTLRTEEWETPRSPWRAEEHTSELQSPMYLV